MTTHQTSIAIFLGSLLAACSLSTFEETQCETNSECRSAFGFGSVCGSEGFCDSVAPIARCQGAYPEDLITNPDEYSDREIIGIMSVQNDPWDLSMQRSAQVALETINGVNGIDGQLFGAVICNMQGDFEGDGLGISQAAVLVGTYLADTYGVSAIQGPNYSGAIGTLFDEFQSRGEDILLVSGGATSITLTGEEPPATDAKPGLLWRTSGPDVLAPKELAKFVFDKAEAARALDPEAPLGFAIIADDQYSLGFPGDVKTELVRLVATSILVDAIPVKDYAFTVADSVSRNNTFDSASTDEVAGMFDTILFLAINNADNAAFVSVANNGGNFTSSDILLPDLFAHASFFTEVNPSLRDRIKGVRPKRPDSSHPAYSSYLSRFAARFVTPGSADAGQSNAPHGYDAAWMIAGGIAWAGYNEESITGTTIARGLRKMTAPSVSEPTYFVNTGWAAMLSEFKQTKAINVDGASGTLDYDLVTEELEAIAEIWALCADTSQGNKIIVIPDGNPDALSCAGQ